MRLLRRPSASSQLRKAGLSLVGARIPAPGHHEILDLEWMTKAVLLSGITENSEHLKQAFGGNYRVTRGAQLQ